MEGLYVVHYTAISDDDDPARNFSVFPRSAMRTEEKLNHIRDRLQKHASNLIEESGSFRAEIETGHCVYIYPETGQDKITAHVETEESDPDKRLLEMETVRIVLSDIFPFAEIAEFELNRSQNNRYIYTAPVDVIEPDEESGKNAEKGPSSSPPGLKKELQLQDKLDLIREAFNAGEIALLEVSGSFRAELGTDQIVYIFPEIQDNSITIRFETRQADPENRQAQATDVHNRLARLFSFAAVSDFQPANAYGSRFVFVAGLDFERGESDADRLEIADEGQALDVDDPVLKAAFAQMETVDARVLRESLDNMYLKRSSKVRIALSKIHRSMEDITEFESSIRKEAKKIISSDDQAELQMVRSLYSQGPLKPIVDLLWDEVSRRRDPI